MSAMEDHKKRHRASDDVKKHCCKLCPYSTKYSSHLRKHIFTHTGERPFKCNECSAGFTQNSLLRKHMLKHAVKTEVHKCQKCYEIFEDKKTLETHEKVHEKEEKKYQCFYCRKKFSKTSSLLKHEKKHTRDKSPNTKHNKKEIKSLKFSKRNSSEMPTLQETLKCSSNKMSLLSYDKKLSMSPKVGPSTSPKSQESSTVKKKLQESLVEENTKTSETKSSTNSHSKSPNSKEKLFSPCEKISIASEKGKLASPKQELISLPKYESSAPVSESCPTEVITAHSKDKNESFEKNASASKEKSSRISSKLEKDDPASDNRSSDHVLNLSKKTLKVSNTSSSSD